MFSRAFLVPQPFFFGFIIVGCFQSYGQEAGLGTDPNLCRVQNQIPHLECEALVALYESTNGPGWVRSEGWPASSTPCQWWGVSCEDGHVVEVDFQVDAYHEIQDNRLEGELPSELGNLVFLRRLDLSRSFEHFFSGSCVEVDPPRLRGRIPPELGSLAHLEYLNLFNHCFEGGIPAELGNLSNLEVLYLGGNFSLKGLVPPELGNLSRLKNLNLSACNLEGEIPSELGRLSNLVDLSLARNNLSGAVPAELGQLTNLEALYLFSNGFSGSVPRQLANLNQLRSLELDYNRLEGSLPEELGRMENLTRLSLSHNLLQGELPSTLVNVGINLSHNACLTASSLDLINHLDRHSPGWDEGCEASCADFIRNGTEAYVDCGGVCFPCETGALCHGDYDCQSNRCVRRLLRGFCE